MSDHNLINRYVHEVGRHLPKNMREDVTLEIRTALEDLIEEGGIDAQNDSRAVADLLRDYGNPEKVAASYLPERRLIGPRLYPTFLLVFKIVLAVVGAITLIGFALGAINNGLSWVAVGHLVESLLGSFFSILGTLAFVFFLLERFGVGGEIAEEEDWNPADLPQVEDPNRYSRNEMIVSILFSLAGLIILNYFPHWVGVYGFHDGEWSVIARLAPEFSEHIPWLSVLWALEIVTRAEVLRSGAWNRVTRFAEFGLSIFGIAVVYRILTGGPILTMSILTFLVKGALLIAIIVSVIETIGQAYRLIVSLAAPKQPLISGSQ